MKDGAAKTRVASFAAWLVVFLCLPAGAMCQSFEPKGQHAVVLGLDSNQVYLAVAPAHVSLVKRSAHLGRCMLHPEQEVQWLSWGSNPSG